MVGAELKQGAEMSEFDEIIIAPGSFEGDFEQAARKLYTAVARATDKYALKSPIHMRLRDGHDNEIAAYVIALDEQGNVATVLRGGERRELDEEGIFAGLFLVLTDRAGNTRTVKIIIEGRTGST